MQKLQNHPSSSLPMFPILFVLLIASQASELIPYTSKLKDSRCFRAIFKLLDNCNATEIMIKYEIEKLEAEIHRNCDIINVSYGLIEYCKKKIPKKDKNIPLIKRSIHKSIILQFQGTIANTRAKICEDQKALEFYISQYECLQDFIEDTECNILCLNAKF